MKLINKETGYFKSFDGTRIYYERRGEGPPIVFVYGIGCLINHWQKQIRYFSEKNQTIVFDYRAHHKSDTPEDHSQISIEALAKDLPALLEHLDIPQATFVGHSFGTQVLLKAFDRSPDIFKKLVFVNGFATDPIAKMFGNDLASRAFYMMKSGFDSAPETMTYIWEKIINNPVSVQATALMGGFNIHLTQFKDIEIYLKGVSSLDLGSFIQLFENMMSYDGRSVFEHIKVPTLIIGGKKDSVTPEQYQIEMHENISGSQLLMVPYGSHCTQLDMPDFVNLRIDKFLSQAESIK